MINTARKIGVTLIVLLAVAGCTTTGHSVDERPDFDVTLKRHLAAIENRDLPTIEATITTSDQLNVIFPDGTVLENTQAVVDFHAMWFADSAWVFESEVIKIIEGQTQSTALVKYDYRDRLDSPPRSAWLVLTFQLENNEWRLIHDQNTRIESVP